MHKAARQRENAQRFQEPALEPLGLIAGKCYAVCVPGSDQSGKGCQWSEGPQKTTFLSPVSCTHTPPWPRLAVLSSKATGPPRVPLSVMCAREDLSMKAGLGSNPGSGSYALCDPSQVTSSF